MKTDCSFVVQNLLKETLREISSIKKIEITLSYRSFDNATFVPSSRFNNCGLLDNLGNSIPSSSLHELCQVRQIKPSEEIIFSDEIIIYIGILHNVWGHCLTDALKKLWFLKTEECKQMLKDGAKIAYLLPDNVGLKSYAIHLYELADVNLDDCISVVVPTKFRKVIIPDNSIVCKYSDTKQWMFNYCQDFSDTISSIKRKLLISEDDRRATYNKIYLTRTGINTKGREVGEKSLERVFRNNGFTVISPEKLTLEEQYHLLSHCKELAVTEGSVSHSAIFCQPGTKIYLLRKSYYVNGYQSIINEIADLDVTYIDAHHSLPEMQYGAMYGPFYMCITPELERFVGHKLFHLPLWMRPSWWWYCNRNRKIVHLINRLIGKE